MPPRPEWPEEQLDYLWRYYALFGSKFIRRKYPHLTGNAIRQMATRMALSEDMQEFTSLNQVAEAAGVHRNAVDAWLTRTKLRRYCRPSPTGKAHATLIPAPVVRLYLHESRRARRLPGLIGCKQAADLLQISPRHVRRLGRQGKLRSIQVGNALYFDPADVRDLAALSLERPPPNWLPLHNLAQVSGLPRAALAALPARAYHHPTARMAHYTTADAACAFLAARGHREEMVETLLRKAQAMDVSKVKP